MSRRVYPLNPALLVVMTAAILMAYATPAQADEKSDVIQLVNVYRASLGLHTLRPNAQLDAAAQNQANFLAETGLYTHSGYGGSQPDGRAIAAGYGGHVGENFVAGLSVTPQWGVNWWKNSYIHNYNMTRFRFSEVGIGYAYGHEQHWYVLVLGDPGDAPSQRIKSNIESNAVRLNQPNSQQLTTQNEMAERGIPVVAPVRRNEPEMDGSIWHTMEAGQALWTVAMVHGVTVDDLLLYNDLRQNDFVPSGRRIKVRLADHEPEPIPRVFHEVEVGESLWSISRDYGIDYDYLLSLNGFSNDISLDEGDKIRVRLLEGESIPPTLTPTITPTPIAYAIVQEGQTGFDVALAAGISLAELWEWNNMGRNDLIYPGDKLFIIPPAEIPQETATPEPTNTSTPLSTPLPANTTTPEPTSTLIVLAQLEEPTETPRPTAESETSTTNIIVAEVAAEVAEDVQLEQPQLMQSSMGFVGSLNDTFLGVIALGMIIAAAVIRVV